MPKRINIEPRELWDENKEEFVYVPSGQYLIIEHSLSSLAKWEEKYEKPFIDDKNQKTVEETLDYIKMMTLNDVDDSIYEMLSKKNIEDIKKYMDAKMTATTINKKTKGNNGQAPRIVTAELLYYWMFAQSIPIECEHWHLNKLITLIEVSSIENDPDKNKKKKMTSSELTARRIEMEARRKKYHTNG